MDLQVLVWSRRAFLRAVVASMFVVINAMPVIAQVSALTRIIREGADLATARGDRSANLTVGGVRR